MAARRRNRRNPTEPDRAAIVQPRGRLQTQWSLSLIRTAELSADNGDLRLAAQLCEWLLGDDRIARQLHTRAQALLGLTPTFEASGDKRRSAKVVKALEGQEDYWDGWPEPQLTELTVWGILLGVSFARHSWEVLPGHGGRILPLPKVWDAQHVRRDRTTRKWIAKVTTGNNPLQVGTDEAFEAGDGTWIVHAPYGADKPWLRGLWRGLARFRLLRDHAVSDLDRLGETVSRNVVEQDKDAKLGKDTRVQLANDLMDMGRDGTIVLPAGLTYKLVTAGAGAVDVPKQQFEIAEKAIDIAIRGGNLTTNVQGGSRAAAEVQERTGDRANLKFDAQSLTTTVHDQSMTWWAEFNFGDAQLAPWPVYPVEEEEDLKEKTEGEEKSFAVVEQAEKLGFEVDRQRFLEEHKITWAKPGKPKAPPKPPTQTDPPRDDESDPDDDQEDRGSARRRPEAKARAAATQDAGEAYVDRLEEQIARDGARGLAPTLAAVIAAVQRAESYDEARDLIEQRYQSLATPAELAQLTEAAMVMGELAGRLSADEEARGDDADVERNG